MTSRDVATFAPGRWYQLALKATPVPAEAELQDADGGEPATAEDPQRDCSTVSQPVREALTRLRGYELTHGDVHALIQRAMA